MTAINAQSLQDVLTAFDASSAQQLDLKTNAFEIHLDKTAGEIATNTPTATQSIMPEKTNDTATETNQQDIKAPLVGIAYLAPKPGAAPFVQVGDIIKVGQTVAVIEAMKLINEVPSTVAGKVTRIIVTDETLVEFGAPLIEVEVTS
ncbi:acetyl-CoA carboxylase biotin carboxyl carrier protein [Lactiplantibacillus fabifermentans]|nr:biotin/lipoyl-containing protein [Lactiplantibacillus fabifermentans]ETY74409.1 acetyl-CoA carboxylase [Lactiplantibacillus fabifermentans T30PCM01]